MLERLSEKIRAHRAQLSAGHEPVKSMAKWVFAKWTQPKELTKFEGTLLATDVDDMLSDVGD